MRARSPQTLMSFSGKSNTFIKNMNLKEIRKFKKENPDMPKSMKEKFDLREKALKGDANAMMKHSFICGMITPEQYEDYLQIEKELYMEAKQHVGVKEIDLFFRSEE